ncbi:putative cytochrome P450 hydroxylase [Actinokineospora spheciospongiae]|uniref:Putative cytochrome P450 hydroxylase n=1 Tax=Actinokineospora spheciospongiae TaxID=909613 RepID=W7ISK0_9PSEU|nr:cytochrome P450 [Actinokineospora spheciospongiae]EWC63328.1 putative cytochrome P450 hydroxylase [Actinokineospora spheciospongiae]
MSIDQDGAVVALADSPVCAADPYPGLARLRGRGPAVRVQTSFMGEVWLVTRYELARTLLADPRFSRRRPDDGEVAAVDSDPPEHTRIRKLVGKAFTHHRIQRLRPWVQGFVDAQLDELVAVGGPVDLLDRFAYPLPIAVICEMLGAPAADRADVRARTEKILEGEVAENREKVYDLTKAYIKGLIATKRAQPGDDLMSALIAAREGDSRFTEPELVELGIALIAAGYATTTNLIGNGIHALLRNPDQLDLLRRRPELIGSAVEEFLRYESSFSAAGQIAKEDVPIGDGLVVRSGQVVLISFCGANRDPLRFPDPDRLDITRAPNPHLAFSHGIHHCLGAPLARMEAEIAIGTLVRRFPDLRIGGTTEWRENIMRGLHALPVVLGEPT